jgi:RNA polymerase sigma factor (TIGR02999 family)
MEELMPIVYDELRRIAAGKLRNERADHLLSATALVHETWLEVRKLDRIIWKNRSHYLAIAVQAMRRILIDQAIARNRQKRGGGQIVIPLEGDVRAADGPPGEEILALRHALVRLQAVNARRAAIVDCRFRGGMTVEETADALRVSPATVKREWAAARIWLLRALRRRATEKH